MPQCFDESGPVYVVSPKGFMTVLRNVEINLPGPGVTVDEPGPRIPTRQLIFVRGERSHATVTEIHALAIAALQGDVGAGIVLADLVQEQHTGQASELRAEIQRRVDEATEKEREACALAVGRAPLPQDQSWLVQEAIEQWGYTVARAIRERSDQ